jgi:hypothetical protein
VNGRTAKPTSSQSENSKPLALIKLLETQLKEFKAELDSLKREVRNGYQ